MGVSNGNIGGPTEGYVDSARQRIRHVRADRWFDTARYFFFSLFASTLRETSITEIEPVLFTLLLFLLSLGMYGVRRRSPPPPPVEEHGLAYRWSGLFSIILVYIKRHMILQIIAT